MKEFLGKTPDELRAQLAEKREALRAFRFEVTGGKVKNVKSGRMIRTAIARILTILNASKMK